jgi:hypothetical protein
MVAGKVSRAKLLIVSTASPSATPSRRLNDIVTEGSCPEWFTERGPALYLRLANAPRGTIGWALATCPAVERI